MAAGLVLAAALTLVLMACAVVEPPLGGPVDKTRPHLEFMIPDSGSTELDDVETIYLTFSEKMDRVSGVTWLHFFPDQRIWQTKWHGAIIAEIILEQPMPADTVIVVEVAAGMRDAHKVPNKRGRRYPLSTGGEIPSGRISGVLIMADSAVTTGVIELYDVPPDTLEYFQQKILSRTVTDKTGAYTFDWLPVPGGPWLMRAYADANGDLRPGDVEAQRLLPDTMSVALPTGEAIAGVTTLYAHNTPGRLLVSPFAVPDYAGTMGAWTIPITDADTGWVPVATTDVEFSWLEPDTTSVVTEVKPGVNRLILFVDIDGDSTFSGVHDSVFADIPDSIRTAGDDSIHTHFLEPWYIVENVEALPGLQTDLELPVERFFNLTPWTAPPPVAPDTTAMADTMAVPDTTTIPPLETE